MIADVFAPATTANLGPGFDVLGAALDLEAVFRVGDGPPGFRWPGGGELHGPNLFLTAFEAAFALRGLPVPQVGVEVRRALPLRSGLGSSASAICAGLRAADLFLAEPLGDGASLAIAAGIEGHPDNVAACLLGGVTIASGVAQPLVRRLPAPPLRAIALHPGGATSTPRSRAALPAAVERSAAVHNLGRTALLVYALMAQDFDLLREATADQLHESERLASCPWCSAARAAALGAGALAMPVSGSGPTMLAIVEPERADAVLQALRPLAAAMPGAELWPLAFGDRGARSEPLG